MKNIIKAYIPGSYKQISFDGGYMEAERKIWIVENEYSESNCPIVLLKFKIGKFGNLGHRNVLGTLMSKGIKRELIGDIIVNDDGGYILCKKEISDYLMFNVDKISNASIKLDLCDFSELDGFERAFEYINETVASLRLDSVCSKGFNIKRDDAKSFILGNKVYVNYELENNTSKKINENDIISIRGYGKIVFDSVLGKTKKDRYKIVIRKYI